MTVATQNKTADIIEAMLKENTGWAFMDSGDYYGRHYQRNQSRDFKSEDACQVEINGEDDGTFEVIANYNVYHFLVNHLEYTEECEKFEKQLFEFAETPEYKEESWLTIMEAWAATVHEEAQHVAPYTANTYNFDNLLSQVIQYTAFEYDGKEYLLLQIHGGCDVRGGYTKPRIFQVLDSDYFTLDMYDLDAFCTKCRASWYSDDSGYHFYTNESKGKEWSKVKYSKRTKALKCPCGGKIEFFVREDW